MSQCNGTTNEGLRCANNAQDGDMYCHLHTPNEINGEEIPFECPYCKKQGFARIKEPELSHLIKCTVCNHEILYSWCDSCEFGGTMIEDASSRPDSWKCTECGKDKRIPETLYQTSLPFIPYKKSNNFSSWKRLSRKAKVWLIVILLFFTSYILPWNRENVLYFSDLALYLVWLGFFPLFLIFLYIQFQEKTTGGKLGVFFIAGIVSFLSLSYIGIAMDHLNKETFKIEATFKERQTALWVDGAKLFICPNEAILFTDSSEKLRLCLDRLDEDVMVKKSFNKYLIYYGPVTLIGRSSLMGVVIDRVVRMKR